MYLTTQVPYHDPDFGYRHEYLSLRTYGAAFRLTTSETLCSRNKMKNSISYVFALLCQRRSVSSDGRPLVLYDSMTCPAIMTCWNAVREAPTGVAQSSESSLSK